jgi:hypothetical protein
VLEVLAALAATGGVVVGGAATLRWTGMEGQRGQLVASELRFPRDLSADMVERFFTGAAGSVPPWPWRRFVARPMGIEVVATSESIRYYLVAAASADTVLTQLRAAMPTVVVVANPDHHIDRPVRAVELGLSSLRRPLRTDWPEAVAASLLGSLEELSAGERVVIQWLLAPVGPIGVATPEQHGTASDHEATRAARAKADGAQWMAVVRIGVTASPGRAKVLASRVAAAHHMLNAPGAHLRRRRLPNGIVTRRMARRSLPIGPWPLAVNAAELTSAVGLPIGAPAISTLVLGGTRPLPPSGAIARTGIVLAESTYPGQTRPLALTLTDARTHTWVTGPTGSGKSWLLAQIILQWLEPGRTVVVWDPKGDLITDLVDRATESWLRNVIVLDPADPTLVVGFNPLVAGEADSELVVDLVLGTMERLWAQSWGIRTSDTLSAVLRTIVGTPGASLLDVETILANDAFRRALVSASTLTLTESPAADFVRPSTSCSTRDSGCSTAAVPRPPQNGARPRERGALPRKWFTLFLLGWV